MPCPFPQSKLASHEAVTIVENMLQELLRGILTPERAQSPVDASVTEEDLFHHRNPQVQAQRWPLPMFVSPTLLCGRLSVAMGQQSGVHGGGTDLSLHLYLYRTLF